MSAPLKEMYRELVLTEAVLVGHEAHAGLRRLGSDGRGGRRTWTSGTGVSRVASVKRAASRKRKPEIQVQRSNGSAAVSSIAEGRAARPPVGMLPPASGAGETRSAATVPHIGESMDTGIGNEMHAGAGSMMVAACEGTYEDPAAAPDAASPSAIVPIVSHGGQASEHDQNGKGSTRVRELTPEEKEADRELCNTI